MTDDTYIEHDLGPNVRISLARDAFQNSPDDWSEDVVLVHFHRQFHVCPSAAPVRNIEDLRAWCTPEPTFDREVMAAIHMEVLGTELPSEVSLGDAAQEIYEACEYPNEHDWWQGLCEYMDDLDEWDGRDRDEWDVYVVSSYIHSGVTLTFVGDPDEARENRPRGWDVSTCGAVFVRKTCDWKISTRKVAEQCVGEWNTYLSGDVWAFDVEIAVAREGDDVQWESVSTLGGLYGEEYAREQALEQARYHLGEREIDGVPHAHEPNWEASAYLLVSGVPRIIVPCKGCNMQAIGRLNLKTLDW